MKRAQLRELSKKAGVTTTGTDAGVADKLILNFEDLHNANSDVMINENYFFVACKGFPERTDYSFAYRRIK